MAFIHRGRFALLFLFVCIASAAFTADLTPTPQELIKAANDSGSLSREIPYQFAASMVLSPDKDVSIQGQIAYFRGQDQERIEITAGDYHEIRVRTGDKLFVVATHTLVLPRRTMMESLEKAWTIHYNSSCCLAFGKVERKKTLGTNSYCFVVNSQERRPQRFCVDRESKSLLEASDGFETLRFMDYRASEGFRYPTRIQVIDDGKTFLEIQNIEIRRAPGSAESFNAPANAQEFAHCADQESAHTLHLEMPHVPSRWHSSFASVYGLVQPDGSFSDVQVQVSHADEKFALALKEAALHWKFSPARCGSKSVVSEEQLEIHN
jgi:hypothetical protein